MTAVAFAMPRLTALARHALPRVVEGMLAPVVAFYVGFLLFGLIGGLIAAVSWVYGAIAWRLIRGRGVPGTMILAGVAVTARAGVSLMTGSVVVYFLQPTLGTFGVSMAFLASVPLGRPLAQRLAVDLVPLPDALLRHELIHRFFRHISLLWAAVLMANASVTVWLLLSQSLGTFLVVRTLAVASLSAAGVAISVYGFSRCLRRLSAEAMVSGPGIPTIG